MKKKYTLDDLFSFVDRIQNEEQAVQAIKVLDRQDYLGKADKLELQQIVLEKYYKFQQNT